MTQTVPDNETFHPLPPQFGQEIFRCLVGSGVHGVTVAGSDDRDEMGICIEPPNYVIGLDTFEQWIYRTQPEGHRSGSGDLDLTVYSLRKWVRLALQGNPTVILPLFVPPSAVIIEDSAFTYIRANAEEFLSKQNAARFLGYMKSQREQMLGIRGKKHTNRPELIEIYGYDTKFAYHMLRLGIQGIELLTTGTITLPMRDYDRDALVKVREGFFDKEHVIGWAEDLEAELKYLAEQSKLPDFPNRYWANSCLEWAYKNQWSRLELL